MIARQFADTRKWLSRQIQFEISSLSLSLWRRASLITRIHFSPLPGKRRVALAQFILAPETEVLSLKVT